MRQPDARSVATGVLAVAAVVAVAAFASASAARRRLAANLEALRSR